MKISRELTILQGFVTPSMPLDVALVGL